VQALSGQTIGVTAAGTSTETTETTAKLFLAHFGLLGQVRLVPTGGTIAGVLALAALERGLVTGGILGPPWTTQAAQAGYDYLLPIWSGKKIPTVDRRGIADALRFSPSPKAKAATPEAFFDNSIIESLR